MNLITAITEVEPYYLEPRIDGFQLGLITVVGLVGIICVIFGITFLFQAENEARRVGVFMFIFGFAASVVGGAVAVGSFSTYEDDKTRFIAWVDDTYGITLQESDLSKLEGEGIPQDDGSVLVQKRTANGGILLYQKVTPEEIRPTVEPIPEDTNTTITPLPEKSD